MRPAPVVDLLVEEFLLFFIYALGVLHAAAGGARVLRDATEAVLLGVAANDLGALAALDAVDRLHGNESPESALAARGGAGETRVMEL